MKVAAPFLILLGLLIALQLARWQIVTCGGGSPIVYRLDRLTGGVELSISGGEWRPINHPEPSKPNEWGDHEAAH